MFHDLRLRISEIKTVNIELVTFCSGHKLDHKLQLPWHIGSVFDFEYCSPHPSHSFWKLWKNQPEHYFRENFKIQLPVDWGDSSIFWRVIIPNGFYSGRFYLEGSLFQNNLSRRVIIPKILFRKFLFPRVIILNFRITTLWNKNHSE